MSSFETGLTNYRPQDSCTFYNKVHVLPLKAVNQVRSNRKPVQDTIKDGKALILQHKGALTVGAAIECSLSYFIRFENLCKVQLLAEVRLFPSLHAQVLASD